MSDSVDWKAKYEAKCEELSTLAQSYEDFQQSSRELEAELEKEVSRSADEMTKLQAKLDKTEEALRKLREETSKRSEAASTELLQLQNKLKSLEGENAELKIKFRQMEQEKDDLERRLRISNAKVQDLEYQLDVALENGVLLQGDLEALQLKYMEDQQRMKDQLRDLQLDFRTLDRQGTATSTSPEGSSTMPRSKSVFMKPGFLANHQHGNRIPSVPELSQASSGIDLGPADQSIALARSAKLSRMEHMPRTAIRSPTLQNGMHRANTSSATLPSATSSSSIRTVNESKTPPRRAQTERRDSMDSVGSLSSAWMTEEDEANGKPAQSQANADTKAEEVAERRTAPSSVSANDIRSRSEMSPLSVSASTPNITSGSSTPVNNAGWFMIDCSWYNKWKKYITGVAPRPGPVDNSALLGDNGLPKKGLVVSQQYIAVRPGVWEPIFAMYGGGPVIKRKTMDIYGD